MITGMFLAVFVGRYEFIITYQTYNRNALHYDIIFAEHVCEIYLCYFIVVDAFKNTRSAYCAKREKYV